MHRWLAIAGCLPLVAAAAANAQSPHQLQLNPPRTAAPHRVIDLRLTQEPAFDQFGPATTGFVADTPVAANTRIGFHLMTVTRPKLGPEWRTDGRSTRARKPAVSLTFKF